MKPKSLPKSVNSNTALVNYCMEHSKTGAIAQMFIIDTLTRQAEKIASMSVADLRKEFGDDSLIGADSWHAAATELKTRFDEFYGR